MPVRAYYLWRFTVAQLSPGSTYAPPICRKSGIVQSGTPGSHGTPMSRRETASRIQYGKILLKIAINIAYSSNQTLTAMAPYASWKASAGHELVAIQLINDDDPGQNLG
ncbi:hypothetical protein PMIN06_001120 [Paraphaeosphaeria minitans]